MGILLSEKNPIPDVIAHALIDKRMNQKKLAEALNISEGRLSKVLRGIEEGKRLRIRIQSILGVTVDAWQPKEEDDDIT